MKTKRLFYLKATAAVLVLSLTFINNACSPLKSTVSSSTDFSGNDPFNNPTGFSGVAELPRVYVDTAMPVQSGQTIHAPNAAIFQTVLDNATPGDTIILTAGVTYRASFTLPSKNNPDNKWIIIKSSRASELPTEGSRVTPAHATLMPKIVSVNPTQAIIADQGANYYRFIGVEVTDDGISSQYGPDLPGGGKGGFSYGLIDLGQSGRDTNRSHLPHHIIFDRSYIHGQPNTHIKYGISMDGIHLAAIDSYFSDFHGVGQDTQAIRGFNGSGPFKIVNNYLEAAGENVMFGGADPSISGLVPGDIEIRRNYIFKPLTWKIGHSTYAGIPWTVKNLIETKNIQRLLMEGNIFENSWPHGQTGFGFVLKSANQDGACSWCVSQDLVIRYNILKNTTYGMSIHTLDQYSGGGGIPQQRVSITHNLLQNVGSVLFQLTGGSAQGPEKKIEISHNTAWDIAAVSDYPTAFVIGDTAPVVDGLTITNNILVTSSNGGTSARSSSGWGLLAFNAYVLNHTVRGNAFIMNPETNPVSNNLYIPRANAGFVDYLNGNFELLASSPLKGTATDGGDPGVNMNILRNKTSTALLGN